MTTIHVTQGDIDKGKPSSNLSCPIALAANRQLDGTYSVNGKEIRKRVIPTNCVPLPDEAVDFAFDFDHGNSVEPFSFEVEL